MELSILMLSLSCRGQAHKSTLASYVRLGLEPDHQRCPLPEKGNAQSTRSLAIVLDTASRLPGSCLHFRYSCRLHLHLDRATTPVSRR